MLSKGRAKAKQELSKGQAIGLNVLSSLTSHFSQVSQGILEYNSVSKNSLNIPLKPFSLPHVVWN